MGWEPVSENELKAIIKEQIAALTPQHRRLWATIATVPMKWSLSPWGDEGGGFWVVALVGSRVIWYNDIEDGFELSHYDSFNIIADYSCNQDTLSFVMHKLFDELNQNNRVR